MAKYIIEARCSDSAEWSKMVNMPDFETEREAKIWLDAKNVDIVADILQFRIAPDKQNIADR